jgi:hypothetical protein
MNDDPRLDSGPVGKIIFLDEKKKKEWESLSEADKNYPCL